MRKGGGLSSLRHRTEPCLYIFQEGVELATRWKRRAGPDGAALQSGDCIRHTRAFLNGFTGDQSIEKPDAKRISRSCRVLTTARDLKARCANKLAIAQQHRTRLAQRDPDELRPVTI